MASILLRTACNEMEYYPLGQRTTVIGRDEAVALQVLDGLVSRKHMQIYYDKSKNNYYALDMKSRHGTFINGRRIQEEILLAEGDRIQIGNTTLLFSLEDFTDYESAMDHFKKSGERRHTTESY